MLKRGRNNTDSKQREVNMSAFLVPRNGRNLLLSSAALANEVETIIYPFPRLLAKEEVFPAGADSNLYFMDAIVSEPPEFPYERSSFDEPFDVTCGVNEELEQKEGTKLVTETQESDTGVVNDAIFSVTNYDTLPLATVKQQNHANVAIHGAAQPLDPPYTDVPGRETSESQTNIHYQAKPTGNYACLASVYSTDGTCDEVPSGHRLQRFSSESGGECTDRLGKISTHLHQPATRLLLIYQGVITNNL